ncbi:hypothetical protein JXR93_08270 [bacterium]|nr:hypothetical protein [bacterium]
MKLSLFIILFVTISPFLMGDPFDSYDGTESWYQKSDENSGSFTYFDSSYAEDMTKYQAYLKMKQNKSKFAKKNNPFSRSTKAAKKADSEKMDELDRIKDNEKIKTTVQDQDSAGDFFSKISNKSEGDESTELKIEDTNKDESISIEVGNDESEKKDEKKDEKKSEFDESGNFIDLEELD